MSEDVRQLVADALAHERAREAPVARLPRGTQWGGLAGIVLVAIMTGGSNWQVSTANGRLAKLGADIAAMQEAQGIADEEREKLRLSMSVADTRFGVLEATVQGLQAARSQNQQEFERGARESQKLRDDWREQMRAWSRALERCEIVPRRPVGEHR